MHEAYLYLKKNYSDYIDVTFAEQIPWPNLPAFLKTQGSLGTELLFIDSTASWGEALRAEAAKHPHTWYICAGSSPFGISKVPPNVRGYASGAIEGSFLAGVAAGLKTKTNKVAFLGAKDYPSIVSLAAGFELGVKWINPDVKFLYQFVGSYTDPEKGYENAKALIAGGVDVMYMWASESGLGAIKACKEKGVWMIGAAVDQSHLAPNRFITSVPVDHWVKAAIAQAEYRSGTLTHGLVWLNTVAGRRVITPLTNVSEDIKATVERTRLAIFAETFTIPKMYNPKKLTYLNPEEFGIPAAKNLEIK
jgi:basic membrane protein A